MLRLLVSRIPSLRWWGKGSSVRPPTPLPEPDPYYGDVKPHVIGFDWRKEPVNVLHPYKAPYNLTFGMTTIPTSELIEIDSTYLEKVDERKRIMSQYPDAVLGVTEHTNGCVEEMYRWLTGVYLPKRFPSMFRLEDDISGSHARIMNMVDGKDYPLEPPSDRIEALRIMGALVDEDFLFMLPSPDGEGYSLAAYVNCFANGDHTKKRLHMKLRDIHAAVPGYSENLARRLDVCFDKLEVGKIVVRTIWAMTDDNRMFVPESNSPFSSAFVLGESNVEAKAEEFYIRSERQTLRGLPVSRAIVFSLKTYLYPIADIKAMGYGQDLIAAIDGLGAGNAPGMIDYKKSNVWGENGKAYLQG